ncbi:hypothetical protein EB796_004966 [Bugula neritina]|uniref:Uncharacterized protein n=1 Tax=Bugula neritina TaxID=10212 RepID=A0A7J7KFM0_BUGNE|nr:hypothetical protein EB796_004966 [Bugula neritina]
MKLCIYTKTKEITIDYITRIKLLSTSVPSLPQTSSKCILIYKSFCASAVYMLLPQLETFSHFIFLDCSSLSICQL